MRAWLSVSLTILSLCLALGALALPALPLGPSVEFRTEPSGLQVFLSGMDPTREAILGRSGSLLTLPPGLPEKFHVGFGYGGVPVAGTQIEVDREEALRVSVWPPRNRPAVRVVLPRGLRLRYLLCEHLILYGLSGAGLICGVAYFVRVIRPKRALVQKAVARQSQLDALLSDDAGDGDPLVGSLLGPWRLVRPIGDGGMATVYLGVPDNTLDESKAAAVKVIRSDVAESIEFRERFRREAQVGAGLRHGNIPAIFDSGDEGPLMYMAMELVDGHTLREEVRPGGSSPATIMSLFGPVFEALVYAHGKGVVHRDLKPENIMVTGAGRPVVMDFGLARRQDFQTLTVEGSILGTPAYMAPEQIGGASVDARGDQYALGIMLYEFSTGRTPFAHIEDPIQVIMAHFATPAQPLGEVRDDLPIAWSAAVMRMMAKSPAERFGSLREARKALMAAL